MKLLLNSLGEPDDRARYVDALRRHFEANRATLSSEQSRIDARQEPAAGARLEAARGRGDHRRRAARSPSSTVDDAAAHFAGVQAGSPRSASRSRSTTRWCAASTTTVTRRSSSRAARSTRRRTRSAAAVATTVSSSRSAVRRPTASASPSASTARCWPATTRACSPAQPLALDAFVVDTTGGLEALRLTAELRAAGLTADRAYENRSMKAQMKVADRSGAAVAVIIGSNELAEGAVTVRPLRTDDGQQTIARSTLIDYLKKARS